MFTRLEATLARELQERTDLSMADYTVLSNLVEHEGRRWRVTGMAKHMEWSQSRLSHQIRRMEERNLVAREEDIADGRGTVVVLTRQGLHAIASAAPAHFQSVREHFIDLLTGGQLEVLGEIADTILDHFGTLEDLWPGAENKDQAKAETARAAPTPLRIEKSPPA